MLSMHSLAEAPSAKISICITCHGVDGRGNESIHAPKLAGMESWYIRNQLLGFKRQFRGTHVNDMDGREMRAIADFLDESDIEEAIGWIKTWPVESSPVTVTGDAVLGRALYQSCAACHGQFGQGNVAMAGPALAGQSDWYLVTQLENFKSGIFRQKPTI